MGSLWRINGRRGRNGGSEHSGVESLSEDRRKHLEFIQAVVSRMSTASGVAKGWALTIATATYGYAGTKHSVLVGILGVFAVLLFAAVDSRYLREERKYRMLYDGARHGRVEPYDMNATGYCESLERGERKTLAWGRIVGSWSVRDYYGLILIAGLAVLASTYCRG